jgi:hypothetical protein
MKTLLTTVAFAVVLATPALSQTAPQRNDPRAFDPYAYARDTSAYGRANDNQFGVRQPSNRNNPSYDVYDDRGQYVGSDPDPRIRDQLSRDPTQGD